MLNTTFITLIPKIEGEKRVTKYKPISPLSGVYKILAKVLASKLKNSLPKFVSWYQLGGIEQRQIQEGGLVANELIDSCNKENILGVLLKVDFQKAFDIVSWYFLDSWLKILGLVIVVDNGFEHVRHWLNFLYSLMAIQKASSKAWEAYAKVTPCHLWSLHLWRSLLYNAY